MITPNAIPPPQYTLYSRVTYTGRERPKERASCEDGNDSTGLIVVGLELRLEGFRCDDLGDDTEIVTEEEGAERREDANEELCILSAHVCV